VRRGPFTAARTAAGSRVARADEADAGGGGMGGQSTAPATSAWGNTFRVMARRGVAHQSAGMSTSAPAPSVTATWRAWQGAAAMGGWLAGVAWHLQRSRLDTGGPALAAGLGLALAGLLWLVWPARWPPGWRAGCAGLACALAGLLIADAQAGQRLRQTLPDAWEGRDLRLTGVVATLPQTGPQGVRFVLEVDADSLDPPPGMDRAALPRRLALAWYTAWGHAAAGPASVPAVPAVPVVRAGERWRLTVRLRRPHGLFNPHGFDRELSLFEQGVRATGSVRRGERLEAAAGQPVQRWRQWVRDGIEARVPDPRAAGVLTALAVGDQGAIEPGDWDIFRSAGVAHLMSISGLHVTMFAWLAAALIGWAWRRSARAVCWCPAPRVARWGGLAAALAYAVFSGWGVPAQRTVWMLAVVTLLWQGGRRWPWPWVLLAAATVVTAGDPWALLQPGFWLSFMAVALLMISPAPGEPLRARPPAGGGWGWRAWQAGREAGRAVGRAAREGLRTQWVATWGLAPLSLVFFQQVSVVGLAANLVAIPLVTLLITPLALVGAAWPAAWSLGAWLVQQLSQLLGLLASWPAAVWTVAVAPGWAQAAGLLAGGLWMARLPWPLRALALPLVLPLLWPAASTPPPGHFELLAADVGQGTAVLVRTQRRVLLFDAGPTYSRESDAGRRVLLPLLQALGHARLDRLVLSHRDTDHVGGAPALLGGLPIDSLWSSIEPRHAVQLQADALGVPSQRCEAGQSWQWDGVRFDVLHPPAADYARPLRPNALSCVVRVQGASGASALLTGDIEKAQEAALVAAQGEALASTVLVVPHHGSGTSSTPDFLAAVRPAVAVVQAGHRNRFGHPAPQVLKRYEGQGIPVRSSPRCGAWRWRSEAPVEAARCERDLRRRYWHAGNAAPAGEIGDDPAWWPLGADPLTDPKQ
jgi:competence protein ComEC